MARPIKSVPEPGSQAERMRNLREAMGYQTQHAFAKKYGFSLARWNGYERGKPVSRLAAKQLVRQIPGLSTGWIEDGAIGDLSTAMARRLGLLPPGGD
jgi:transcriptional regulator with XRE-family HTH domain